MREEGTIFGALRRAVQTIRSGLLAAVAVAEGPDRAFAYIQVIDAEELSEAERRAALERMRRQGLQR